MNYQALNIFCNRRQHIKVDGANVCALFIFIFVFIFSSDR